MTSSPQAPPPGLTVDGYTLLSRLGEGGMGVVHLAQRPGEPRVALKVLRPHIVGDDEARQRLAREVGSLSRIRSPRIAEIVDADPYGDIPYVATRYVPGLSLHDHVQEEGILEGTDLVHFAAGLAEALAAVHACGVLHRDIKPGNVLLEGRSPVLIDFGLARVADDPRLTHTGWLLGTPGYLAPEILYGDDADDGLGRALVGGLRGLRRHRSPALRSRPRDGDHGPRPARRAQPRRPPAADGRAARRGARPEPHRRPTLPELIAELRPEPVVDDATVSILRDDPFTVPLAVAARSGADLPTTVEPDPPTVAETEMAPTPTRPYTQYAPQAQPLQPAQQRPAGAAASSRSCRAVPGRRTA